MINNKQYEVLMTPIRGTRVSSRSQGGKQLSYVEAWDIKAHLTRIFGFGNWDCEMLEYQHITDRPYTRAGYKEGDPPVDMLEVAFSARVQLTIRDPEGNHLCRYSEGAVGNASGPVSQYGELLDNALKSAASDALKRCAINMGSQFGLSLYDKGNRNEVIRSTIVTPPGYEKPEPTAEQTARLDQSLGTGVAPDTMQVGASDIPAATE